MSTNKQKIKHSASYRRQRRTRAKIFGTAKIPRLNVAKSLSYVYLQLIDDEHGRTLVSFHSKSLKASGTKTALAEQAGAELAKRALAKKIKHCVFDRGASIYHGRVKAVAQGARQGGLKF